MCGIAGWLGSFSAPVDTGLITRSIAHRGPDDTGERLWPNAGLLHTRLRIIDLSPAGAQPMTNEDGSVWVTFNGEIYNHHEIRRRLEARGHVFRGRSDTEILPHLYEEQDHELFAELRGMFVVAIFDVPRQRLLIGRDRFGIKPLFYAASARAIAFASEVGAVRHFPDVDLSPDRQAIADYASLLYIPAPRTMFRGIAALEPGSFLDARLGTDGSVETRVRTYHRWSVAPSSELSLGEAVDRADELVETAVARQLESDVPLGALLSGGIDSSLVSAAAQRQGGTTLRTFNVQQPDAAYDETAAAVLVAGHIGSDHRTLAMDSSPGTWDRVTGLLHHAGQPFADTSLFAVDAVSALMREHVTVALSGDGGDEGFGGYDLYRRLGTVQRLRELPAPGVESVALALAAAGRTRLVRPTIARGIRDVASDDDAAVVQSLYSWVREAEHRRLVHDAPGLEPPRRLFERQWSDGAGSDRLDVLSRHAVEINVRLVLPNDYLFKVDIGSMRHGLEVRVPLLDEDLMEFGLALPHALRANRRSAKLVLRGVAGRRLPRELAGLPKRGFTVPIDRWVDRGFRDRLRAQLLDRDSRLPEFFDPRVYRPWVLAFASGTRANGLTRDGLYQRVFMLLALDLALRPAPLGR